MAHTGLASGQGANASRKLECNWKMKSGVIPRDHRQGAQLVRTGRRPVAWKAFKFPESVPRLLVSSVGEQL